MSLLRSICSCNFQRRSLFSSRILLKQNTERELTDIEKKLHIVQPQRPEDRSIFEKYFLSFFAVGLGGCLIFWNHIQQFPELHRVRDSTGAYVPTTGVPASTLLHRAQGILGGFIENIKNKILPSPADNSADIKD